MNRQGLYVKMDEVEACRLYTGIANATSHGIESDDYYWRACYRLGVAYHYGEGVEKDIEEALRLMDKAKTLYDKRTEEAKDITKEELYREWNLVNQKAGKY